MSVILMSETAAPVILERKAKKLRQETGNDKLRSKLASDLSPQDLFKFSIVRPIRMLLFSPICAAMSIYVAITYAYLYILFTTFTAVYSTQYGWRGGVLGLSFLGLGIGSLVGQWFFTQVGNKIARSTWTKAISDPSIACTSWPVVGSSCQSVCFGTVGACRRRRTGWYRL